MNIASYKELNSPAIANCGHTFEALKLKSRIQEKSECPTCGKELTSSTPNLALVEVLKQQATETQEKESAFIHRTSDEKQEKAILTERIQKIMVFLMESQLFAIERAGSSGGIPASSRSEFELNYESYLEKLYTFPSEILDSSKDSLGKFDDIKELKKIHALAQFLAESRHFEITTQSNSGGYAPGDRVRYANYVQEFYEKYKADSNEIFVIKSVPKRPQAYLK